MRVIASEAHRQHDALEIHNGQMVRCSESPERADMIATELRDRGHDLLEPTPIDTELLRRIHPADYTEFLDSAWQRWVDRGEQAPAAMGFMWPGRNMPAQNLDVQRPKDLVGQLGYYSFAGDTTIVDGTWTASLAAASIAVTAAGLTSTDQETTYGLCRPPGHHAMADQFGGYCFLNNAALAAQRLLDDGAERVAILDVDYHHGNGTQSIFYNRSDVLFVSIHADPAEEFPWFAGHASETGAAAGEGANVNLPLARGSDWHQWSRALDTALLEIQRSRADALVVSLGVDTYEHDPLGTFTLSTDNFSMMASRIRTLCLPTVILQEGGYAVHDLGANVAAFLNPWV